MSERYAVAPGSDAERMILPRRIKLTARRRWIS
jgi:hypothetical protein